MKKVLLAAIVLMSTQAGFSQINKGNWLAGGSAGFASVKHGTSKYTDIFISPDAGYFFADKLAAGINLDFYSSSPSGGTSSSTFTAAPFIRYYFLPTGQPVNVFANAEYGFGTQKYTTSQSVNEFTISAGPSVFLTPSAALEFALYYASYGGDYYTGGGTDRENTFGLRIGFQVHLGGHKK